MRRSGTTLATLLLCAVALSSCSDDSSPHSTARSDLTADAPCAWFSADETADVLTGLGIEVDAEDLRTATDPTDFPGGHECWRLGPRTGSVVTTLFDSEEAAGNWEDRIDQLPKGGETVTDGDDTRSAIEIAGRPALQYLTTRSGPTCDVHLVADDASVVGVEVRAEGGNADGDAVCDATRDLATTLVERLDASGLTSN